jgi:thiol:disulfide interchange protein DsbD
MLRCCRLAILLVVAGSAAAQGPPDPFGDTNRSGEELVPLRLIVDRDTVHGGETFHVVAIFDIEPKWHIYWINPGAAGLPTEVDVTAPDGFEVGPTKFTRPKAYREESGITFGYEKRAALFVPIKAPEKVSDGEIKLDIEAAWLVCKKVCLFGQAEKTVRVPTSASPAPRSEQPPLPTDAKHADLVRKHRAMLPKPWKKLRDTRFDFDGKKLRITGPAGDHAKVSFFPIERPGVTFEKPEATVEGGRFTIEVDVEVRPGNSLGKPMAVRGLVALGEKPQDPSYDFDLPLTAEGRPADADASNRRRR